MIFEYVTKKEIPSEVLEAIDILRAKNNSSKLDSLKGTKILLHENHSTKSHFILSGELPWSGNYFANFTLNLKGLHLETSCHIKLLNHIKLYYDLKDKHDKR